MSLQPQFIYIIICAYLNLITAISILPSRSSSLSPSSYKPSNLFLPPGFDSEKPPQQPLLYPFAVSPSSHPLPTRASYKSVSRTSTDWLPLALNSKQTPPLVPYSTPTLSPQPAPVLEERVSYDENENVSPMYKEGYVLESIVYGTWKPDPPLQPLEILNDKNRQTSSSRHSSVIVDGKVYNKTINRQYAGFIGNIRQKPTKALRQNQQKYENEKSSSTLSASLEHKLKESTEMSSEQKLQRKLKKQGRQKIRPISSSTTEETTVERNSNREEATVKTTLMTTKEDIEHKQQQEQQKQHQSQSQSQQPEINVIKVNSTDPKLMEVVKQINDSIEFIKYNNKQTSPHSIDMMTTTEEDNTNINTNSNTNTNTNSTYDQDADNDLNLAISKANAVTETIEFMSTEPQMNYDDDIANILENISATRRSWPTDFEDDPLSSTDAINSQPDYSDLVYNSNATNAAEIFLALSALNIPPSLWPKLPGNITKLGKPYEAKSSDEEPALCVPITVREQNIANSRELVFIERVFCFPMPPTTTTALTTSRSTIRNNVVKAKVQNYDDYIDSKFRISNAAISSFKSQLFLVTTILVLYFKIIV